VWVDGSFSALAAGDAVYWPSGSKHCLKNTGEEELVLVCAFSTPYYQGDYEIFEDITPFTE
jgi:mannose-6-phosphate isomerase-like protein (cupin superfamily)